MSHASFRFALKGVAYLVPGRADQSLLFATVRNVSSAVSLVSHIGSSDLEAVMAAASLVHAGIKGAYNAVTQFVQICLRSDVRSEMPLKMPDAVSHLFSRTCGGLAGSSGRGGHQAKSERPPNGGLRHNALISLSGRKDLNPRPQPWQGCA
jgi:hypothetical protein